MITVSTCACYTVTRVISASAHPHYTHGRTALAGTFQRHCETTSSVYVSIDQCVTETFIHLPSNFVTYKFSYNNNAIINEDDDDDDDAM